MQRKKAVQIMGATIVSGLGSALDRRKQETIGEEVTLPRVRLRVRRVGYGRSLSVARLTNRLARRQRWRRVMMTLSIYPRSQYPLAVVTVGRSPPRRYYLRLRRARWAVRLKRRPTRDFSREKSISSVRPPSQRIRPERILLHEVRLYLHPLLSLSYDPRRKRMRGLRLAFKRIILDSPSIVSFGPRHRPWLPRLSTLAKVRRVMGHHYTSTLSRKES